MTVSNVASQVQQPDAFGRLGQLVGIANAGQQYQLMQQYNQQQDIQTQQMQQAWGEKQAMRQWFSQNPQAIKSDGTVDTAQVSPAIAKLAPLTGRQQLQDIADTNTKQINANSAIFGLDLDKIRQVKSTIGDMLNEPLSAVSQRLNNLKQDVPEVGPQVDISLDQLSHIDPEDPQAQTKVNALVSHARSIAATLEVRKTLGTPTGISTSTGQVSNVVAAPGQEGFTGIPAGQALPGTTTQQVVPPTSTTMVNGRPSYVGPQPTQAPRSIAAGPALGQQELAQGGAAVVSNHYSQLQNDAAGAAQFEGIARNIQNLAPKAITGTEADRLNLLNGILAQMGLGKAHDVKSAGDLIQKNMAMLNMTGQPGTDMKMLVTQMAQPHISMAPEAIQEATNQLIGQVRMRKELANYFTPDMNYAKATGDTNPYMTKLSTVNGLTDARAWQFGAMSKEEQKKFRAGLSPEDDAALGQKIKALHGLGMLQ